MKHGSGARGSQGLLELTPAETRPAEARQGHAAQADAHPDTRIDVHRSGIVPARARAKGEALSPTLTLRASRDNVSAFGKAVTAAGDLLLIGSRLEAVHPFATLYRVTDAGVVRERLLRGAAGHGGPSLATDGERIAVGQPAASPGGLGFVSVYRRLDGELTLEATLEPKPEEATATQFGQCVAIAQDLLVLGQASSVCVYRHSAVGWLSAGTLRPTLPYEWNPALGLAVGVLRGRVLVGNPIEIDGHRAGPGRVFVYRRDDDHMELEGELLGDGIEGGRDEPRAGFGASLQVADDFVLVTAPFELSPAGVAQSRVYVFRMQGGALVRFASLDVPSCQGGVCLVGERLFVLGDALYVFARSGNTFEPLATYAVDASETTLAACGKLLALATPKAGEVALHFAEQL